MALFLWFSRILIRYLRGLENEKPVGLGQRIHGGAGHYEWFSSQDWDKDSTVAEKAKIEKDEGSIANSVLLLPKRNQTQKIRRDDSALESFDDYESTPRSKAKKAMATGKPASIKRESNAIKPQTKAPVKTDSPKPKSGKSEFKKEPKSGKNEIAKITLASAKTSEVKPPKPAREVKPLAPILTPLVEFDKVWKNDAGVKVLVVDLNSLKSSVKQWRQRMEILTTLGRQADHIFIAGAQGVAGYAKPLLKSLDVEIVVSHIPSVLDKYLIGEVNKLAEDKLQILAFTNIHALSQLARKGRFTVASGRVESMSRILAENADAILDLNITEDNIFGVDEEPEVIEVNRNQSQIRKDGKNPNHQGKRGSKDSKDKPSKNKKEKYSKKR